MDPINSTSALFEYGTRPCHLVAYLIQQSSHKDELPGNVATLHDLLAKLLPNINGLVPHVLDCAQHRV